MEISEILQLSPVVPVVTIHDPRNAVPLAKILLAAGISLIEISLRTEQALTAIGAISENLPGMLVGAGSVTEPEQFRQIKSAGAHFVVSPGLTPPLMAAARQEGLPYVPGAVTPCEILAARQMGFTLLKFFPAELFGGVTMLKTLLPIFPDIEFYPAGGISRMNMNDYLTLKNVIAVSGTWITPENLIKQRDWDTIGSLAREAMRSD